MHVAWVNLTNGGLSGGSRKYLKRVVPRMLADPRITRLDMLSPAEVPDFPRLDGVASHWTWGRGEKYAGFPSVRRHLARLGADVVYVPTARSIDPARAGLVVMVRNMEPLLPQNANNPPSERLVNKMRRWAARRACARAKKIIAVSDFVASQLQSQLDVPPEKISRIYHGVDDARLADSVDAPAAITPATANNFLFLAGSIRPMRGIEDAIRAMQVIAPAHGDLSLVIAGAPEGRVSSWLRELRRLTESLGVDRRVIWAGKLNDSEMAWCYQHCRAFLMTSRVEACPNTALEAMSHGAPTLSTRNPPMPEFFQAGALYYSAGDPVELASSITECLQLDTRQRAQIREAAAHATARFTWAECVNATVTELERAATRD